MQSLKARASCKPARQQRKATALICGSMGAKGKRRESKGMQGNVRQSKGKLGKARQSKGKQGNAKKPTKQGTLGQPKNARSNANTPHTQKAHNTCARYKVAPVSHACAALCNIKPLHACPFAGWKVEAPEPKMQTKCTRTCSMHLDAFCIYAFVCVGTMSPPCHKLYKPAHHA